MACRIHIHRRFWWKAHWNSGWWWYRIYRADSRWWHWRVYCCRLYATSSFPMAGRRVGDMWGDIQTQRNSFCCGESERYQSWKHDSMQVIYAQSISPQRQFVVCMRKRIRTMSPEPFIGKYCWQYWTMNFLWNTIHMVSCIRFRISRLFFINGGPDLRDRKQRGWVSCVGTIDHLPLHWLSQAGAWVNCN